MSVRHFWRRFKPSAKAVGQEIAPKVSVAPDPLLWTKASAYANELFPGRKIREEAVIREIQSTRDKATATNDPMLWCAALILQAPRAARAQEQMDEHPHGYHNKQARLFELIDFNDTYVSCVLSLPEDELSAFVSESKRALDAFCQRARMRCFTNEQYEAITHGLSREIAVYRGVQKEGFEAYMTNRVQDALGIDMVITDPATHRSVNVDCKSNSAFYYRLKDLQREGRLTSEAAGAAEDKGHCRVINGDEHEQAEIVLWRIDEQTYGEIKNFSFTDTAQLATSLRRMMDEPSILPGVDIIKS